MIPNATDQISDLWNVELCISVRLACRAVSASAELFVYRIDRFVQPDFLRQMVECGPAGMRACRVSRVGFRVSVKDRVGVIGLAMVLGLVHFTFLSH